MSATNNTLEILVNLIYLARHSIDDPQKVMEYLEQAQSYILQMAETLPKSSID
ncbi:hypothetical protein HDF16_006105 [Granulicella aggregans]|uniref:Uncharacterized protein n=1 Tax=Granulicella aggregans TaxID=474949 RepID=A0A7W8E7G0_9BACT|nr:hypothetical protein [Granulicella aggregans]MBB5061369.1 hypothetical protein [Granulicella aggregans]